MALVEIIPGDDILEIAFCWRKSHVTTQGSVTKETSTLDLKPTQKVRIEKGWNHPGLVHLRPWRFLEIKTWNRLSAALVEIISWKFCLENQKLKSGIRGSGGNYILEMVS